MYPVYVQNGMTAYGSGCGCNREELLFFQKESGPFSFFAAPLQYGVRNGTTETAVCMHGLYVAERDRF